MSGAHRILPREILEVASRFSKPYFGTSSKGHPYVVVDAPGLDCRASVSFRASRRSRTDGSIVPDRFVIFSPFGHPDIPQTRVQVESLAEALGYLTDGFVPSKNVIEEPPVFAVHLQV